MSAPFKIAYGRSHHANGHGWNAALEVSRPKRGKAHGARSALGISAACKGGHHRAQCYKLNCACSCHKGER